MRVAIEAEKLIAEMHEETSYSSLDYDPTKVIGYVSTLIDRGQFVYVDCGVVMLGAAYKSWFGSDVVANDILLYVSKDSRGSGLAKMALDAFCDWSRSVGAKRVVIGQTTGVEAESFSRLVDSCSFDCMGSVYVKEV